VNCADIARYTNFLELPLEEWQLVQDVNPQPHGTAHHTVLDPGPATARSPARSDRYRGYVEDMAD